MHAYSNRNLLGIGETGDRILISVTEYGFCVDLFFVIHVSRQSQFLYKGKQYSWN